MDNEQEMYQRMLENGARKEREDLTRHNALREISKALLTVQLKLGALHNAVERIQRMLNQVNNK